MPATASSFAWKAVRWTAVSIALASLAILGWIVLVGPAGTGGVGEGEYNRVESPDGRYVAIATYPLWELTLMRFPGQSGDKSGHIRIEGVDGTHYGAIPVPMVSFVYDVRWEENGASFCCGGEWDFATRTFWYWDEDQEEKIRGTAE